MESGTEIDIIIKKDPQTDDKEFKQLKKMFTLLAIDASTKQNFLRSKSNHLENWMLSRLSELGLNSNSDEKVFKNMLETIDFISHVSVPIQYQ
jgi:hypothetical protein